MVYFEIISNLKRNYRKTKKVTHHLHPPSSIVNTVLHFYYSLSLTHTHTDTYSPTHIILNHLRTGAFIPDSFSISSSV